MMGQSSFAVAKGGRSSKSPRVCVLATDLSTGGGVNRVLTQLSSLFAERLRLDTTLINARNSGSVVYPLHPDVKLRQFGDGTRLWRYLRILWRLRKDRFDFVVGPWTHDNILLTLLFLGSRTRAVLMEHAQWHYHSWLVRLARRIIYPLAWRVCALNPTEYAYYAQFLNNLVLMPNPVQTMASSEGFRGRRIIAVGHLTPLKNFTDTIRAMALSGLEGEGWSLTIVGEGPEHERLSRMIRDLELTRTTIEPPNDSIQERYANTSLLLHTSVMEVFPMVLAEGMAAGVVPLAYEADGRRFILEEFPENLIPFGDVAALASRMRDFANKDLSSLRLRLRRSIERRFSTPITAERWRELFDHPL